MSIVDIVRLAVGLRGRGLPSRPSRVEILSGEYLGIRFCERRVYREIRIGVKSRGATSFLTEAKVLT
jgi:hypothetical protein